MSQSGPGSAYSQVQLYLTLPFLSAAAFCDKVSIKGASVGISPIKCPCRIRKDHRRLFNGVCDLIVTCNRLHTAQTLYL